MTDPFRFHDAVLGQLRRELFAIRDADPNGHVTASVQVSDKTPSIIMALWSISPTVKEYRSNIAHNIIAIEKEKRAHEIELEKAKRLSK